MRRRRHITPLGLVSMAVLWFLFLSFACDMLPSMLQTTGETLGLFPTRTATPFITPTPEATATILQATIALLEPHTPTPAPTFAPVAGVSDPAAAEQTAIIAMELTALAQSSPTAPPPSPTETLPPTEPPTEPPPPPTEPPPPPPPPVRPVQPVVPVIPTPEPTETATEEVFFTATPEPTASPTPSPTFPPPGPPPPPSFNACQADTQEYAAPNYPVRILEVNKRTEVFALQNVSDASVSLQGWVMCSVNGSQRYDGFSSITLQPHETRRFVFPSGSIWANDERDDGSLYNDQGQLISYWFNF